MLTIYWKQCCSEHGGACAFFELVFLLDKYQEVELLGCMLVLFLLFWGTSTIFSIGTAPIYIPTNCTRRITLFHVLSYIVIFRLFIDPHSDKCEVMSHCGFDSHFLMISDAENFFMCLLTICISSLEKYLFIFSAHSLLFAIEFYEFFLYLRYMLCKDFLTFSRLSLHFVDGFLCYAEALM